MKKFMIRCDVEGVSGVVSYDQAEPGKPEYEIGRKWFMSDLTALVKGLMDGGADEVHIYDEHCSGRNILLEELSGIAEGKIFAVCGKPPYRSDWAGGLDESFAGLFLLGLHSMRGTKGALLNHTYEPDIRSIRVNGVQMGEIGVETAIAGDFHVPLVLITGDSRGVEEAQALIPGVIGVSVKESLSEFGAVCYPLADTYARIYNAAKSAVENSTLAKPYHLEGVTMELEFFDTVYARKYAELFGSAVFQGERVLDCYAQYWQNKLAVNQLLL